MKGNIVDFSIQNNHGVIRAHDHNHYHFIGAAWRGEAAPQTGDFVQFELDSNGDAIDIVLIDEQPILHSNQDAPFEHASTLNPAEAQYNMIDWFMKCIRNYATFTGRARRKEYWYFTLVQCIVVFIAALIDSIIGAEGYLYLLVALLLVIPSVSVAIRRFHDIGRPGWTYLITLIPIIGSILLIIWMASDTKPESNQWGNPAK